MTEYNNSETVTISLERYEELKKNQNKMMFSHEERAMQDYMNENGLTFFYKPQKNENFIEIITLQEAKKREEEQKLKTQEFIKKVTA